MLCTLICYFQVSHLYQVKCNISIGNSITCTARNLILLDHQFIQLHKELVKILKHMALSQNIIGMQKDYALKFT